MKKYGSKFVVTAEYRKWRRKKNKIQAASRRTNRQRRR